MKKWLVGVVTVLMTLSLGLFVTGCASSVKVDYEDAMSLQKAIDKGEDVTGKTVRFNVIAVASDMPEGYVIPAAEFLTFASEEDPGVQKGDTVTFKVIGVEEDSFGNWRISYEKL